MKRWFLLALISTVVFSASAEEQQLRKIELTWEEQPDAKAYELEIYTNDDVLIQTKGFKTNEFVFEVPTGKYLIRSRPFDRRKVAGPWSEKTSLDVPPKKIEMMKLDVPKVIASEKTLQGSFHLQWPKSDGAIDYELVVYDTAGVVVKKVFLSDLMADLDLPPGKFQVQITPRGDDEVPAEPSAKIALEVTGAALKDLTIAEFNADEPSEFRWASPNKAVLYSGKLERKDLWAPNDPWEEMDRFQDLQASSIKYDEPLEPGLYRLTVRSRAAGWVDSKVATREFVIKPQKRELSSVPAETAVPFDFAKISD